MVSAGPTFLIGQIFIKQAEDGRILAKERGVLCQARQPVRLDIGEEFDGIMACQEP